MDLVITSVMTAFAFVSMIAGLFGMNLRNAMEDNHVRGPHACVTVLAHQLITCIAMPTAQLRRSDGTHALQAAFLTVSYSSLTVAAVAFASILFFAIKKRLLYIPDLQR